jgi:glycosyltransferase involved in cell wall biosynthesis
MILSVGRAVEKKGYDTLVAALAALDPALHWRFVHIGGGPLLPGLKAQADAAGLTDRMSWRGSQSENEVRTAMRQADLFALTPTIAGDGDRDGLPNVLVEAQSQGLTVVSTRIGGVGELIETGVNGILCEAENAAAIAAALTQLIAGPDMRKAMGETGRDIVETRFSAAPAADDIAARLRQAMTP